jgi:hypothetical protein
MKTPSFRNACSPTLGRSRMLGASRALVALLLAAGGCGGGDTGKTGAMPPAGGAAGGAAGGTGGMVIGGTTGGTGGSIGAGGSGGGAMPGTGGGAGGTGGSSGAGGSGGGGAGGGGAPGNDSGPGAGTGGSDVTPNPAAFAPCTDMPDMMPPALKKTAIAMIPGGMATQPGQIVGVPGDPSILYVVGHKTGDIYIIQNGKVLPQPLVHMNILTNGQNEQGMLSMALHPDFLKNGLFYILTTVAGGNIHIEEFQRMSPTMAKATGNVVFDHARVHAGQFHNGGSLYFNPKDGGKPLLYHSAGNNLSPADSAKPDGVAGRILRHDLGSKMATTVAYGLRNPYRMSIDRLTGDMWISDTGDPPGGVIYFLPFGKEGVNFGYGSGGDVGSKYPTMGGHQGGGGGIIGGVVYRGHKIKGLCGRYFFGMWDTGVIRSIVQQDGKVAGGVFQHPGDLTVPRITSFGEDGEGEIYMSSQSGAVYKLEAGGGS